MTHFTAVSWFHMLLVPTSFPCNLPPPPLSLSPTCLSLSLSLSPLSLSPSLSLSLTFPLLYACFSDFLSDTNRFILYSMLCLLSPTVYLHYMLFYFLFYYGILLTYTFTLSHIFAVWVQTISLQMGTVSLQMVLKPYARA